MTNHHNHWRKGTLIAASLALAIAALFLWGCACPGYGPDYGHGGGHQMYGGQRYAPPPAPYRMAPQGPYGMRPPPPPPPQGTNVGYPSQPSATYDPAYTGQPTGHPDNCAQCQAAQQQGYGYNNGTPRY